MAGGSMQTPAEGPKAVGKAARNLAAPTPPVCPLALGRQHLLEFLTFDGSASVPLKKQLFI